MSLSFVLVEPSRAANVGAAARAIKTMGFTQLVLVGSSLHLADEARWLAHGATDILDNSLIIEDMAQLRQQFDLLIATTARERGTPRVYLTPSELSQRLSLNASDERLSSASRALVFGRESTGLTNDELAICDLYSYVPLANPYPSMNLAQAVMVYSYALSQTTTQIGLVSSQAQTGQVQALKAKAQVLLDKLALAEQDKLTQWLLDGAALLSDRDCKMAHQLVNDILKKLS